MNLLRSATMILSALTLIVPGCGSADSKEAASAGKKAEPVAPAKTEEKTPAAEPVAEPVVEPAADPDKVELEVVDVPELGKLKLPKGREDTAEQNWSYKLSGHDRISINWEPHGAKNLKDAEKQANILGNAPTSKTSKTLDNGTHLIERVRDSDGWTFVAVFGENWYVRCSAPPDKMDICHEIVTSKE